MNPPIPDMFNDAINTWKTDGNYEYVMWDCKTLPKLRFSRSERFFKKKVNQRYKLLSDLYRYQLLYDYGGLYVDVDMVQLKPIIDILDCEYACFHNPPRKSSNLNKSRPWPCNGLLWVRNKHSDLMKDVIDCIQKSLNNNNKLKFKKAAHVSGPYVIDAVFKKHNVKRYMAPIFVNSKRKNNNTYVNCMR